MTTYIQNRDAGGDTDERGHDHFQGNVFLGNIVDGMKITASATPDSSVIITAGDLKIAYKDYNYLCWSDSDITIGITGAVNTEVAIVAYIDLSVLPDDTTTNNPNCLKVIQVAGSTTSMPTDDVIQNAVGTSNPWLTLGRVVVASPITTGQISNLAKPIQSLGMLQSAYPIGAIYINALDQRDPADIIGIGTWKLYGQGKNLMGVNSSNSDYSTSGKTGGAKNVTIYSYNLPSHTHSGSTSGVGNHAHTFYGPGWFYNAQFQHPRDQWWGVIHGNQGRVTDWGGGHNHHFTTNTVGGGQSHTNLQPYVVVKIWERIA